MSTNMLKYQINITDLDPSFDLDAEMCANVLELVQKSIPFRLKIGRLARAEAGARMGSPAGFEMETLGSVESGEYLAVLRRADFRSS